jgi:hypothetical protein
MRCHRPATGPRIPEPCTSALAALTAGAALAACGGAAALSSTERAALQNLQKSVLAVVQHGPDFGIRDVFRVRCTIGERAGVYVCDVAQSGLGTTTDHFYNVRFSTPSARCWKAQDRDVPQYRLDGCLARAGGGTASTANGKPGN